MGENQEVTRLRNSLNQIIRIFENRVREMSTIPYYKDFIREYRDEKLYDKFKEFFGEGDFKIVGIDGSLTQERRMEMLIFYVCAVGFYGYMNIKNNEITLDMSRAREEEAISISTSIPLWMEDIPNIDPEYEYAPDDFEMMKTIDSIPYALMTMSELKLANDQINSEEVKVVILDRMLSGTYGPASRDFRNLLKRGKSIICK